MSDTVRVSTEEAARRSGVSKVTLFGWVRKGFLGPPRVVHIEKGKGRRAEWSEDQVLKAQTLALMSASGIPLAQAAMKLGSWQRQYRCPRCRGTGYVRRTSHVIRAE